MKRRTLNAIMLGVIIVLVIGIVVCIPLINNKRKLTPLTSEEPSSVPAEQGITFYEESSEEVNLADLITRVKITDDNINVRSGPGTDFDRLGSAYYGNMFDYVSQSHDGWTKIVYDGKTAYVYTQYVELVSVVMTVSGEYSEYLGLDAPSQDELIVWSDDAPAEGEGEGDGEDAPAEN
jgi:uncharacterized protein YraI